MDRPVVDLALDPTDRQVVYLAGHAGVFGSAGGGATGQGQAPF